MNSKYILAIVIAAIVLLINQTFIQYFLNEKRYDARTINLAGKQRMLSQKINLEFYKIAEDGESLSVLNALINTWESTHYQLMSNDEESYLSSIHDSRAVSLMSGLGDRIDFIKQEFSKLQNKQNIDIERINESQNIFLKEMNEVVQILEDSSEDRLNSIVWIEIILMLVSLFILTLEVIFIFRPIHKKLKESLTETRKAKKQLELNLDNLAHKNRELEQFAFAASHDLQEPLRTIISFIQLLQRKYRKEFEHDGKEEIEFIVAATRRMKALISGLLEYTRTGKEAKPQQVDCNQLVNSVQQDLSSLINEKNALVQIGELPTATVYEKELRRLFQNLITNALKFQKKEVRPSIEITGKQLEDEHQFSVKDNGIGISKEYHETIFAIFKRLHSIEEYQGTGIGLAQCRKIVEHHGGKIWVDSKENEGSTFHFTLSHSLS